MEHIQELGTGAPVIVLPGTYIASPQVGKPRRLRFRWRGAGQIVTATSEWAIVVYTSRNPTRFIEIHAPRNRVQPA